MAPTAVSGGCTTRRRVRASTRKPRRTQYKKRVLKPKSVQQTPKDCFSDTTKPLHFSEKQQHQEIDDGVSTSGCSTPKAERFRIPEIVTCPPAPKKPRPPVSSCSSSLHRSPIAYLASPDIELFFFVALRDVSG